MWGQALGPKADILLQVYIHPTPSAKDNIPGYIALLQQKPAPDSRPTSSSSSTTAKSKAAASLLLAWLPESSLGDALNIYVKVDLAEGDSPPKQSYLVPPPPTSATPSSSIGHYAFAIPVSRNIQPACASAKLGMVVRQRYYKFSSWRIFPRALLPRLGMPVYDTSEEKKNEGIF